MQINKHMSCIVRKSVFGVSKLFLKQRGCTTTEDGQKPEILDLGSRGILLSLKQKQRR